MSKSDAFCPVFTPNSQTSQLGFTLVEIVVVVVIISIFAGMMSLSVGSSESRKNRAFYEHLIDSLQYVRLLSAERMQPMGLTLQANKQGQVIPVIVALSDPYVSYQQASAGQVLGRGDARAKNVMELSAMSRQPEDKQPTPTWQVDASVRLPEPPETINIDINSLDEGGMGGNAAQRPLQPWFAGQDLPQVIWFGTGQATPVTIEIKSQTGLVGEVITVLPNGSIQVGQLP